MTTTRRPYLLKPSEPLILLRSDDPEHLAIEVQAQRLTQFIDDSGLSTEDVLSSPLLAAPLPLYRRRIPEGRRRWDGLNPAMMWHPLMWLPERLAKPYVIEVEGQAPRLETPEEWGIRVLLELSNLPYCFYDAESGGWIDVLALYGLDITDPAVFARVSAWLEDANLADDVLDEIDLDDWIRDLDEPDWAVQFVADVHDTLVMASWTTVSLDLAQIMVDRRSDPARALSQVREMVEAYLAQAPVGDSSTLLEEIRLAQAALDFAVDEHGADQAWQHGYDALVRVAEMFAPAVADVARLSQAEPAGAGEPQTS